MRQRDLHQRSFATRGKAEDGAASAFWAAALTVFVTRRIVDHETLIAPNAQPIIDARTARSLSRFHHPQLRTIGQGLVRERPGHARAKRKEAPQVRQEPSRHEAEENGDGSEEEQPRL
jgi:hypothetical protein